MTSTMDRGEGSVPPPKPRDTEVTLRSLAMKPRNFFVETGNIARFSAQVVMDLPHLIRYFSSEIFKQAGILILSSGFVIWAMMFIIGNICGVESHIRLDELHRWAGHDVTTASSDDHADAVEDDDPVLDRGLPGE